MRGAVATSESRKKWTAPSNGTGLRGRVPASSRTTLRERRVGLPRSVCPQPAGNSYEASSPIMDGTTPSDDLIVLWRQVPPFHGDRD